MLENHDHNANFMLLLLHNASKTAIVCMENGLVWTILCRLCSSMYKACNGPFFVVAKTSIFEYNATFAEM